MKKQILAALFAFLLGWAGAHKIYLNKITFLFYPILSMIGIGWIISICEGIGYLSMSDKEFQDKYGNVLDISSVPGYTIFNIILNTSILILVFYKYC